MQENERQRDAPRRNQRLGEIADGLEEQSHHLGAEADRLQERADEQHRRADDLSQESQGLRKEQAHMMEQATHIRAEGGGGASQAASATPPHEPGAGAGEAAGFAAGQAVRIRAEAAASAGLPEAALSRPGLVDERAASGAYTFVRFQGIMGNVLVRTGDLVAVTLSEEERAAIGSQKSRE